MSETTETPAPGGGEAVPEPQPTPTPAESTSAPDTAGDTTEATEGEDKAQQREDRRIAALRARLGAAEREKQAQAAELEFYRRQAAGQPQAQETPEQQAMRYRQEVRGEVESQLRTERFHAEGGAQFGDWAAKCKDLVELGADAHFAQLLVEMPEGVRVAAALADDPEAVERISKIGTERGRAIALGKYAASIESSGSNGAAAPARAAQPSPLTRAPAPIRPVTGRASPTFNEYTASGPALAEFYAKQAMERRSR
jgi:hypothetical protein